MAKKIKRLFPPRVKGVQCIELNSWREFYPFINEKLPNQQDYIFRGQRMSSWKQESSLDRALKGLGQQANAARVATQHLSEFRLAIRGRRGVNPKTLREREQWALGQHYGLWTPLLDWTESPFVALYFAFEEPDQTEKGARAVFALSRSLVQSKSMSIAQKQVDSAARPDVIEIITPMTDENARLVSQGGLFTRGTSGREYDYWIYPLSATFKDEPGNYIFAKRNAAGNWQAIYIGQTFSLSQHLASHEREQSVIRDGGATHILVHLSTSPLARKAEERDLIIYYRPPFNESV